MPLIHHLILAVCVAFSSFSGIPHPREFPWYAIMRPYPLSHMNTHIIKADREVVCVCWDRGWRDGLCWDRLDKNTNAIKLMA